jgi:hypothetical protein
MTCLDKKALRNKIEIKLNEIEIESLKYLEKDKVNFIKDEVKGLFLNIPSVYGSFIKKPTQLEIGNISLNKTDKE